MVSEKQFQQQIVDLAKYTGWRVYHTYDSRRSPHGYPDLTIVKAPRLLFLEVKSDRGTLTQPQLDWLHALQAVTEVRARAVWPGDWDVIERTLREGK